MVIAKILLGLVQLFSPERPPAPPPRRAPRRRKRRVEAVTDSAVSDAAAPALGSTPQGDLDDESFLPVLKPGDWPGRSGSMSRSLLAESARAPLVALGWAGPEGTVFLSAGSSVSIEDAGERALRHLAARRSPRISKVLEEGLTCIVAEGDDHTAAHLLLPDLPRKLGRTLGSGKLLVAIPSRSTLIACRADEEGASRLLERRARELFEEAKRAEREPVFDGCIIVRDGVAIGVTTSEEPRRRKARRR